MTSGGVVSKEDEILKRGPSTATIVGSALTGRRSHYGPQTSAREGGRTLAALLRRGMVRVQYSEVERKWMWTLARRKDHA